MQPTEHATPAAPNQAPRPSFVDHFQRYDRMMQPFDARLIEAAALQRGQRVLDVGCGAGTTSLYAAQQVGGDGEVLGIDVDARAVRVAQQRARRAGCPQVRFERSDAATVALPGGADAIVSRFGTLHFEDPVAAHDNLRRGLRPGGRLHFVCARAAEYNPWASVPSSTLLQLAGLPASLPTGGPFTLSDSATIRRILEDAGFERPHIRSIDHDLYVGADVDDALEFFFDADGDKVGWLLEKVGYRRATDALRTALRPYAHRDGVWMPGSAWLVSARRAT